MKTIRIDKVPARTKKDITKELERSIKRHGIEQVRTVVTNYFKRLKFTEKNRKRIAELQKEIAALKK